MVQIDKVVIVSRLIEGKFPDYRSVIPPAFNIKTLFNVKELAGAYNDFIISDTYFDNTVITITGK